MKKTTKKKPVKDVIEFPRSYDFSVIPKMSPQYRKTFIKAYESIATSEKNRVHVEVVNCKNLMDSLVEHDLSPKQFLLYVITESIRAYRHNSSSSIKKKS